MNLVKRSWLVVLFTLFVGSGTGLAQNRIQLVQGRRPIQDKVSFVIDIFPDKNINGNPRFAAGPEYIRVFMNFAEHPRSGKLYLDGKAVGRFDETMGFASNPVDITYGRHTLTVVLMSPGLLQGLLVDVPGAAAREILDDQEPDITLAPNLSQRVSELERKVNDLEAELANLKKKRNH